MKIHPGRTLALIAAASLAATPAFAADSATRSSQSIPVSGVQKPTKAQQTASEDEASSVQYAAFTGSTALLVGLIVVTAIAVPLALSGGGNSP